ncbi:MAG: BON domain-containing protein [Gammaproteobacteria bacterium]
MKNSLFMVTVILSLGSVTPILNGCAATEGRPSTGQFIDDRAITAKVKAELLNDPVTDGLTINVDTFKGEVSMNGFVGSGEEKRRAGEIARSVGGVKNVNNNLEVK